MSNPVLVTIDGPMASGKTSVSRELANRFGWSWVSTGAFYRGVAYMVLRESIDVQDQEAIAKLIKNGDWEVCMNPDHTQFIYKSEDVTDKIYLEDIGQAASKISSHPMVREALLKAQRDCLTKVSGGGFVAEGRDCGTVVFPQADLKIYLTANSQNRAERRAKEEGGDLAETQAKQAKRDLQDSKRTAAPLQVPENAHVVDTSEMDLQQVVEHIDKIIRQHIES